MVKNNKKDIPKEYTIKIPVFTSERMEREKGIFEVKYQDIIDKAKIAITKHNENEIIVTSDKRNKTIKREIGKITIHENSFGNIPYLLLQVSAYNTNLEGCIISNNEIVQIDNNDKIGSDNNFILLYPQIVGGENQSVFWIILIYDDPKKDSVDNISTAKLVLTKILDYPIKCIKLPTVLEELKKGRIFPQIKMNLNSIKFDENNIQPKFEKYCTKSKFFRKEEYDFNNMPFDEMEELIKSPLAEYSQRIIKLIIRKKEYKITQDLKNDTQNGMNDLVEQYFNMTTAVKENELKEIYNIEFVTSKLQVVLETYLKNGND